MKSSMRPLLIAAAAALALGAGPAAAQPSYLLFEGGPVRPIALSSDGSKLFVANGPENHLEIYDVGPGGLLSLGDSVPVGMEPVAVAARDNNGTEEVWVVNHLSDSVSIVDASADPPRVLRTLLVGDEPRDIVFAGSPTVRAFITTAHRGQHRSHDSLIASAVANSGDPELTTEGIPRADVWVFDADSPGGSGAMGIPDAILEFFADTPRALATDGTTVYVAAFHSGNQTTAIPHTAVDPSPNTTDPSDFVTGCGGGGVGQGIPAPSDNANGDQAPSTGLIVRWNGSNWVDALGCTWDHVVELELPDRDVFAVNANSLTHGTIFTGVGTILFNMAINPTTGKLYVSNTESPNHIRFEGPGNHGGSTVQGRLSETRVSVLDPAGPSVDVQHLNQHIDYSQLHTDAGANHTAIDAQIPHSLATPLQVLVDDANQKVFVAAFGSAKVGVFDVSELEDGSFEGNYDPTAESGDYLATGGGPAGLALNAAGDRLYVYTRFDNRVEVHDVSGAPTAPIQTALLPTAEPALVVEGRPFLYDAVATSGNGEASCASCHIFGDFDSLAWNLGNPDDATSTDSQPMSTLIFENQPGFDDPNFHPMKGPMTTQTLRGLSTHGALHWRGDRVDGHFGLDACNGSSISNAPCDERHSFNNFIVAFEGLVGHEGLIPDADMQKFTDFALELMIPPNPVAELDNSLTSQQQDGHDMYFSCGPGGTECTFNGPGTTDTVEDCDGCHNLDPASGFFGSGGEKSFENEPQNVKVAHLRNMYAKVGMFGLNGINNNTGEQVRGFGFLHDGSVDMLSSFLTAGVFSLTNQERLDLEQLMLAFPTDLAPIVGQQVSLGPSSPDSTLLASYSNDRVDLLDQRAGASFDSFVLGGSVTECELIAKTVEGGVQKGYLRQSNGQFLPDDGGGQITETVLRDKAEAPDNQDLVFTCAPPGSGQRMGIDRDLDGVLDGQDNCPAWPNGAGGGTCTAGDAALLAAKCGANGDCGTGGVCSLAQEDGDTNGTGDACEPSLLLMPEPSGWLALALGAGLVAALRRASRGR